MLYVFLYEIKIVSNTLPVLLHGKHHMQTHISHLNWSSSFEDLTDLARLRLIKSWEKNIDIYLENEATLLLKKIEKEIFLLIKNPNWDSVWYCFIDKTNNHSFWIYSLFILPEMRGQWIWTTTLRQITQTYWVQKKTYFEILPQELYDSRSIPLNSERLQHFASKAWYKLISCEKKLRKLFDAVAPWVSTTTPPTDANTWSSDDQ